MLVAPLPVDRLGARKTDAMLIDRPSHTQGLDACPLLERERLYDALLSVHRAERRRRPLPRAMSETLDTR
jgi:hypothetical protein